MNKNKLLKIFLIFSIVSSVIIPFSIYAETLDCTGPINTRPEGCLPPTLGDLQTTLVSLIGSIYALSGFLFMGILLFNGLIYLIGYLDDAKYILGASIEDAGKRMTQWLIGFLMVLISWPLVGGFMSMIVGESECYDKLNNPMVQFIFPNVCDISENQSPTSTPTSTIAPSPIAQDRVKCDEFSNISSVLYDADGFCDKWCYSSGRTAKYQSFTADAPLGIASYTVWCDCENLACWSTVLVHVLQP
jgi:hypothetical protein